MNFMEGVFVCDGCCVMCGFEVVDVFWIVGVYVFVFNI